MEFALKKALIPSSTLMLSNDFSVWGLNTVTRDCAKLIIERMSPLEPLITLIKEPGLNFDASFFRIFSR